MPINTLRDQQEQNHKQRDSRKISLEIPWPVRALRGLTCFCRRPRRGITRSMGVVFCREDYSHLSIRYGWHRGNLYPLRVGAKKSLDSMEKDQRQPSYLTISIRRRRPPVPSPFKPCLTTSEFEAGFQPKHFSRFIHRTK